MSVVIIKIRNLIEWSTQMQIHLHLHLHVTTGLTTSIFEYNLLQKHSVYQGHEMISYHNDLNVMCSWGLFVDMFFTSSFQLKYGSL